jgi:hypothetical protein
MIAGGRGVSTALSAITGRPPGQIRIVGELDGAL